ncbi:hypothetical protein JAAARDRAFT_401445 [Jaapia argillacea MUCL 33604]|uniref:Uncharacterized protein n=1 Tax=Jaapia argillacea MUCL 33604 TaxID=933084 RepID=A0A067PWF0_9AGAM|nr:hypothetical protein JAAARDRAFT_401445 [Jaapia argillacea MUCL 33604]
MLGCGRNYKYPTWTVPHHQSFPTTTMSTFTFPSEIWHHISADFIADAIHTICTCTDEPECQWAMTSVTTLAAVSFKVRAVTLDLVMSTLGVPPDSKTPVEDTRTRFEFLRTVGLRALYGLTPNHIPSRRFVGLSVAKGSHLLQGYSLYLSATTLRRTFMDESASPHPSLTAAHRGQTGDEVIDDETSVSTKITQYSLKALDMALLECRQVIPERMSFHLRRAVGDEIAAIHLN